MTNQQIIQTGRNLEQGRITLPETSAQRTLFRLLSQIPVPFDLGESWPGEIPTGMTLTDAMQLCFPDHTDLSQWAVVDKRDGVTGIPVPAGTPEISVYEQSIELHAPHPLPGQTIRNRMHIDLVGFHRGVTTPKLEQTIPLLLAASQSPAFRMMYVQRLTHPRTGFPMEIYRTGLADSTRVYLFTDARLKNESFILEGNQTWEYCPAGLMISLASLGITRITPHKYNSIYFDSPWPVQGKDGNEVRNNYARHIASLLASQRVIIPNI